MHSDVKFLEPFDPSFEENLCGEEGERCSVLTVCQLLYFNPLTLEYLFLAMADLEAQGRHPADKIQVRNIKIMAQFVLLPKSKNGLKL